MCKTLPGSSQPSGEERSTRGAASDALALLDERAAYRLMAKAANAAFVDANQVEPSPLALHLVPECLARRHSILPLAVGDATVTYVTATPRDHHAERDLSVVTGRRPVAVLACPSDVNAALDRVYRRGRRRAAEGRIDTGHSVLIADDERSTRTLVRLLLERDGYTVLEAETGREAIDVATTHAPQLISMDLNISEVDGYAAIAAIRRVPALASTPIVVVTSEDGPAVEEHVLGLGADDYILKPFEPAVLTARVKAAFRRQRHAA